MEKLQNLKDLLCSFENLYAAYLEAAKEKHYRKDVLLYTANLEENLFALQKDLLDCTYKVGSYREFYIKYPKPRLIMALGFRDRIVQWAIYRQLNPYVDKRFVQHSYGCRKDKGTLKAAQCLLNWLRLVCRKEDADEWVIIKGDVCMYFYRVDHQIALDVYTDYADDEWFAWLMSAIINNPDVPFGIPLDSRPHNCPAENRLYDVGMPIGNLTSQETANIYLNALDQFCKHVLRLHFYIRYMDDFIILCRRDDAEYILRCIDQFLHARLRLDLSPKSRIIPAKHGCEFVGYRVTPHGLRLRKKTIKHIKSSLQHIAGEYAADNMDLHDATCRVKCYMGMTKNCNGYHLRRWIYENIAFRRTEAKVMHKSLPQSSPRKFYDILGNEDGTVDVYLAPDVTVYPITDGQEYDVQLRVVRGVVPWPDLENDIRARYDAWCESGEVINL